MENLDYRRLKLFFLSILWRASISKREHFSNVKLSDYNENAIRQMLLDFDPDVETLYPIALNTFDVSFVETTVMVQPQSRKTMENHGVPEHWVYTFVLPGFVLLFFMAEDIFLFPTSFAERTIREDGTLIVQQLENDHFFVKDLKAYLNKIAQSLSSSKGS